MKIQKLKEKFEEIFNEKVEGTFFSPGRVNLIGEHIDYNGGEVFPCALTFGTYGLVSKREDKKFRVYSINFEKIGVIEFDLSKIEYKKEDDWANYIKGMIDRFEKNGYKIDKGLNILFYGNIPNGAGLSSSASIEVLMGVILKEEYNLDISMIEIVKIAQEAENKFIGVNCGIMDQFAVGMGKKNKAILLDCESLEYDYAPFELGDISIVLVNTNKRRGLGDSKYNERRAACEKALKELREEGVKITNLCELTPDEYERCKQFIKTKESLKRVEHVVNENERVKKAVEALNRNDIKEFGKLMIDSHNSLRDLYEVTGKELDTLVEESLKCEGVIGARMTGAGFGGCIVSLVKNDKIDSYIENVKREYKNKVGLEAEFYIATPGEGARKLGDENENI